MHPMKKIIVAVTAATAILASCGGQGSSANSSTEGASDASTSSSAAVAIVNFAYDPETIEIAPGETVVWTNNDDIAHTVTSGKAKKQGVPGVGEDRDAAPDGVFDSGTMELDDTFEFRADESGSYEYFCAIHAGMRATLVVR
jgi:manganese oxidase